MTAGTFTSASLREAQRIADEVLVPAALAVDADGAVPASHLNLLAEKGFYSLAAPPPLGTLDLGDFSDARTVVELIAGGCLTTAFVWVQHHSAVMATASTGNDHLRENYLAALAAGKRRAGLAIGAAVRPGPPVLRAKAVEGGYVFSGEAPWVTGWGSVDTLYTAARDDEDMLVFALIDAVEGATLSVEPLQMVAVQSSRTVTVRFDNHFVPAERVSGLVPHAAWLEREPEMLRFNGSLALGVAGRAISMLSDGAMVSELDSVRQQLGNAAPQDVAAARAACSELAMRAATALAVHDGSRAVLMDGHAQRLVREATFLLVFGSRPPIRAALLQELAKPRH